MRDRRAPRGGARNEQVELLGEVEEDEVPADAHGSGRRVARSRGAVAVTGNRGITAGDRTIIRRTMRRLVADPSVETIYFGGALGADTAALAAAHEFRSAGRPRLVVILPDTLAEQPPETLPASRLADEIVELHGAIRSEDRWRAYHRRNRHMVDRSARVVAFWNGQPRSGTGATVSYAEKRGVPVEIVEIEGGD